MTKPCYATRRKAFEDLLRILLRESGALRDLRIHVEQLRAAGDFGTIRDLKRSVDQLLESGERKYHIN